MAYSNTASTMNRFRIRIDRSLERLKKIIKENEIFWFAVFFCLCTLITLGALIATSGQEEKAGIARQVDGTAHRPYVYRQLVPLTIRIVLATMPENNWARLEHSIAEFPFVRKVRNHLTWWHKQDLAEIFLSAMINFVSLLIFAYVFRSLLVDQLNGSKLFFNLTVAFALYGLVYVNREGVYSYDYPLLVLFTMAILLLSRGIWWAYYIVFTLGSINKETTIMLSILYILLYWRKHRLGLLALHFFIHGVIYGLIALLIRYIFAANSGAILEYHLLDHNLGIILNPNDVYDYPLMILFIVILVLRDWGDKPVLFRLTTFIFWPIFGLTLFFGWIDELRDYYEVYPAVIALASITVAQCIFKAKVTIKSQVNQ